MWVLVIMKDGGGVSRGVRVGYYTHFHTIIAGAWSWNLNQRFEVYIL